MSTALAASPATGSPGLADQLRNRLAADRAGLPLATLSGRPLAMAPVVQRFYAVRIFKPAWFNETGELSDFANDIPSLLASAAGDGLRPEDYDATPLDAALAAFRNDSTASTPVDIELGLTGAVLAYASDMLRGRVHPEDLYPAWESAPRELDLAQYLQEALNSGNVAGALRNLAPRHPDYRRLRELLGQYRRIESEGGLALVPPGDALKTGVRSDRVAALRRRLMQSGDLLVTHETVDPEMFGTALEAAVRNYQARNGLEPDGVSGAATLAALNVPVARRIRSIELNMERWRWLPQDLGDRYVIVNIAGFQLDVVEQGGVGLSMPVVVGKRYHATPVFSGLMTYIVFSPYWQVPPSIAVKEILPALRRDPSYLERESMGVFRGWAAEPLEPGGIDWSTVEAKNFPYRFRQEPGPKNSLGRVKFMFPNRYNVYLHDTPAKALFSRASRDFSHGCIRLSQPLQFAEYLLSDQKDWDARRIAQAADRSSEETVQLARPWPVHILYWTAWVGTGGDVNFRPDVYERDERLAEALYN